MKIEYKIIENINFEFCAAPDYLSIELLDENDDAFMEIKYGDNTKFTVNFYKTQEHISIPLSKLEEGIDILKKRIIELKF